MEGILAKREDKWHIIFTGLDGVTEILPIHPDDNWLDSCDGNEGAGYEFDIVKYPEIIGYTYCARLVKKIHKLDKWDRILNSAQQEGIISIEDFISWLKTNYSAPIKI